MRSRSNTYPETPICDAIEHGCRIHTFATAETATSVDASLVRAFRKLHHGIRQLDHQELNALTTYLHNTVRTRSKDKIKLFLSRAYSLSQNEATEVAHELSSALAEVVSAVTPPPGVRTDAAANGADSGKQQRVRETNNNLADQGSDTVLTDPCVPEWGETILLVLLPREDRPAIADLQEEFSEIAKANVRAAYIWYWSQVFKSICPYARRLFLRAIKLGTLVHALRWLGM